MSSKSLNVFMSKSNRQRINCKTSPAQTSNLQPLPEKVDNILQLPTEMLDEIFSYVPDQLTIGQTCKMFYDVSCNVKFYKLSSIEVSNDEIFESMIISKRRFKSFKFNIVKVESEIERIKEIIERFGKDFGDALFLQIPENIIELLNLMPNLERIEFSCVSGCVAQGKLELHKLKQIKVDLCGETVMRIFDQLTPDVLEEINVNGMKSMQQQICFPNQHNVKKIITDSTFAHRLDWKQMKLKSLNISKVNGLENYLNGQNELENLSSYFGQGQLNVICKELKSLVNLELIGYRLSDKERPEMSNLRNLKILSLDKPHGSADELNNFMRSIQSDNIEKLKLHCFVNLPELTITQLGVNLSHLKELDLVSDSSLNIINPIFQHCPKLESLSLQLGGSGAHTFQDGLTHKNLKHLKINATKGYLKNLLKLIESCKKLENLDMSLLVFKEALNDIIKLQPNLKFFKLIPVDEKLLRISLDFVVALQKHGDKLEFFHFNNCVFAEGVTPEMLQGNFKDRLSVKLWNVQSYNNKPVFNWIMDKV